MSTLRFRLSAVNNFLLITSVYRTASARPSASSNQYSPIMPLRAPSSRFFFAKWAILMHIRLSLSPCAPNHIILFVHVTTKAEMCLVTEENEVQEIRIVFDSLTDNLPKGTSLIVIYIRSCNICI